MTNSDNLNWMASQIKQLADELESVLFYLPEGYHFRELIRSYLDIESQFKHIINKNRKPWPLLPLVVCESISGTYKRAVPVAAALYLFRTAAEIFDDIEDADNESSLSSRLGPAISLNVGTTIIMLAERAVLRLSDIKGIDQNIVVRVTDLVNASYIKACLGQHIEFSNYNGKIFSENKYIRSIINKSAGIQCACEVGAILADAGRQTIRSFIKFGESASIAAQLANDILGTIDGRDILGRKITLPVIYSISVLDKERKHKLEEIYLHRNFAFDTETIKNILIESGAVYYTAVKIELNTQHARNILSHIRNIGISTDKMELFL